MARSKGAAASKRVTTRVNFFSCNPQLEPLFSVRAGIPANDALEQASCLLGSARAVASTAASESDTEAAWAAVYLLDMANAIVDAAIDTINHEEHAKEKPNGNAKNS